MVVKSGIALMRPFRVGEGHSRAARPAMKWEFRFERIEERFSPLPAGGERAAGPRVYPRSVLGAQAGNTRLAKAASLRSRRG